MANIMLDAKFVGDIEGDFFVPSYQRGYRWGDDEVVRLLDDIYGIYDEETKTTRNYCLQPIVVKKREKDYELIDGQQRLTTLYLIYKYMSDSSGGFIEEPRFSLKYETRSKSEDFLKSMDDNQAGDNIDFWFISNAYKKVEQWFNTIDAKKSVVMNHLNTYFAENVKVIWYEVDESVDAISLFTRLNIGKIPLTSAELVKAMFLSSDNRKAMDKERQEEIALQWDNMEKELHNDSLWYFLTNNEKLNYQTRIDLILDLISDKGLDNKEKYYTFFYFDNLRRSEDLNTIWQDIMHTFLILKDWYGNHELYHKVGYLIASRNNTLGDIYAMSKGKTKKEFMDALDNAIKNSIKIGENYADLAYDKTGDYSKISRLLLLFNVESVRKNGERTQWFPFDKFKFQDGGKVRWSLEHIHAQQSEGMKNQEDWTEWIRLHLSSVMHLSPDNVQLIERMQKVVNTKRVDRTEFERIQTEVVAILSTQGNVEYMHSISNLALLNSGNNAALSNSTFDVKRNEIIDMDKRGEFIPFCTKMVFLKYYTPSESTQIHFWGQPDRIAYVNAINEVLGEYLEEQISVEKEAN
ncbi:DUF262 domain-containing protein [Butyrivibrio sp. VCB2006]|uniref:DUF262 domain-containing protein n=1 Tax=Butyrivibrio sp. VCB2006 TaxID=1280679 RepID=UPI0004209932|nr:DUF262 domain-containing protein [Butyrivibrio sp. VCB2006]